MTDDTERREGGAWIGQHPDENTERVRENLGDEAERVAVTDNESGETTESGPPRGHRRGERADDDDVRRAGETG